MTEKILQVVDLGGLSPEKLQEVMDASRQTHEQESIRLINEIFSTFQSTPSLLIFSEHLLYSILYRSVNRQEEKNVVSSAKMSVLYMLFDMILKKLINSSVPPEEAFDILYKSKR